MTHWIIPAMPFDGGKSGISNYMLNTLKEMSQRHPLTVYALEQDLPAIKPVLKRDAQLRPVSQRWATPSKNMFWHLFILPHLLKKEAGDAIFLPAANRRALAFYPKPTVATVHDLSQFHVPAKYDPARMLYIKKILPYFLKKAQRFVAISANTKSDMITHFQLNAEQIDVHYNGFEAERFGQVKIHQAQKKLREKYGLCSDFILYIARIEHPGKNHLRLLAAYAKLPLELQTRYPLVFAGADWTGAEVVHQAVKDLGLESRVKFLGFVPGEDLPDLYRAAALYAFPSLYEGFGIPLLEAMASGTPVVCSDCSSLPEIGGNAVLTFNPKNPVDIALTMQRVLSETFLRNQMIRRGQERAQQFSWSKHVSGIQSALNALIHQKDLASQTLQKKGQLNYG